MLLAALSTFGSVPRTTACGCDPFNRTTTTTFGSYAHPKFKLTFGMTIHYRTGGEQRVIVQRVDVRRRRLSAMVR
jgi:hypothetical protein